MRRMPRVRAVNPHETMTHDELNALPTSALAARVRALDRAVLNAASDFVYQPLNASRRATLDAMVFRREDALAAVSRRDAQ